MYWLNHTLEQSNLLILINKGQAGPIRSSLAYFFIMAWTSIRRLADAIYNDVVSGLRGYHTNPSMSLEQLEQDVVDLRLLIIKEYMLQGILPVQDLLISLNCIPVDCDDLDKCGCNANNCGSDPIAHFQIPQLLFDYGLKKAIYYVGTTDKQTPFIVYTKPFDRISSIQKYRKRGKNRPWVYIDVTPNQDGLLDCYIFDAPLIKQITVIGIFKDPRQLEDFQCNCQDELANEKATQMDSNFNFLDTIIKDRLTKQKLYYYKQMSAPLLPNDQRYSAG